MVTQNSFPINNVEQYYKLPPAGQAQECITKHLVKQVLFSQSVKNAPGPDKLSF